MSTLYLRLPSRAACDGAPNWNAVGCPFVLIAADDAILREGVAKLSELALVIAKAQRVALVLAAADVTVLRLQVPPLSASRLKLALPNLVEEYLIADPADAAIVAGAASGLLRTVAVTQRSWLESAVQALLALGARHVSAVPAQLCLPLRTGSASAAAEQRDGGLEMTLRLTEHDGFGLSMAVDSADSLSKEALKAVAALAPSAPITLHVPQSAYQDYQDALDAMSGLEKRVTLANADWSNWIAGANHAGLNLTLGLGTGSGPRTDWSAWRWPAALAAATLALNAAALNIDWWRMRRETGVLRDNMIRTYKSAYPKDSVVLDPIAQMKQKIAQSKAAAGQVAPDDFLALSAKFAQAWATQVNRKDAQQAITSIEYREHSLWIKLKMPGEVSVEPIRTALAAQQLSLIEAPPGTWKIGSAK